MVGSCRLLITFTLILCLNALSFATEQKSSAQQTCYDNIKNHRYENVLESCTETFGKTILMAQYEETYFSYLGTQNNLNETGQLLEEDAKAGNSGAQYAFAEVQWTLVPTDLSHSERAERIQAIELYWYEKAADSGLAPAMHSYATKVLDQYNKLPTSQEHQKGKQFAKVLLDNLGPEFRPLFVAFRHIPHEDNVHEFINRKLDDLSLLTDDEIMAYARSFNSGYFTFSSDIYVSISHFIQLERNKARARKLYQYLFEERQSKQAAYSLSWMMLPDKEMWEASSEQLAAFYSYMEYAVNGKYPKALRWVGCYLACKNALDAGKKLLQEAESLGNTDAIDDLAELEEYGNLYNCTDAPRNEQFIAKFL